MRFNSNHALVKVIIDRIILNEGYCPCVAEKNEDTLCPCKEMREENKCHCSLFVEVDQ